MQPDQTAVASVMRSLRGGGSTLQHELGRQVLILRRIPDSTKGSGPGSGDGSRLAPEEVLVAVRDHNIDRDLKRSMAKRAGSETIEVPASHAVPPVRWRSALRNVFVELTTELSI
jgi:hypothetical protein